MFVDPHYDIDYKMIHTQYILENQCNKFWKCKKVALSS